MTRLPRFKRVSTGHPLQLTPRDQLILRHVGTHRFLNSRQILALVGASPQHLLKRLQALFHAGYLDRPRAQLRYFSEEGPQPVVYALGRKGAKVVAKPAGQLSRYDNRTIKQLYMQHTLLVADVMIAFIRAARGGSLRLELEEDLAPAESPGTAFHWSVSCETLVWSSSL